MTSPQASDPLPDPAPVGTRLATTEQIATTDRLAGSGLLAASFQVVATVVLGLAPSSALEQAAVERSYPLLLGTLATLVGILGAFRLRHRPRAATFGFVAWEALVLGFVVPRTSLVGLAYHGEAIVHHYLAVLCAALSTHLVWSFVSQSRSRARVALAWVLAGVVTVGVLLALGAHLSSLTSLEPFAMLRSPTWLAAGNGLLLAACPLALGLRTTASAPRPLVLVALALLVPLALRVGWCTPPGAGALGQVVAREGRMAVMAAIVAASGIAFFATRPRLPVALWALVTSASGLTCLGTYVLYRTRFGELENGLSGLLRSLFGFPLPYPSYVAPWELGGSMLAVFFVLQTTYGCLLSPRDRPLGLALGLCATAGIGLTIPQLTLGLTAGYLLWTDVLGRPGSHEVGRVRDGGSGSPRRRNETPTSEVMATPEVNLTDLRDRCFELAATLGLESPVTTPGPHGELVQVRGRVGGQEVDLRLRPKGRRLADLTLRVGLPGRGRPEVELMPETGTRGLRPNHAIGRTHRLAGNDLRALEGVDEKLLDALLPFPRASLRLWSAGAEAELRPEGPVHEAELRALIVALCA